MLFFFMHLFACIWYFVIQIDRVFVISPDYYFVACRTLARIDDIRSGLIELFSDFIVLVFNNGYAR